MWTKLKRALQVKDKREIKREKVLRILNRRDEEKNGKRNENRERKRFK